MSAVVVGCAQASTSSVRGRDAGSGVGGDIDASVGPGLGDDDMAAPGVGGDQAMMGSHCYAPGATGEICPPSIFVSPSGDDTLAGDSPAHAVRHVNVGIALALACANEPCPLLVAEGTYSEQVTLHERVSIYGGFSADFLARDPAAHVSRITSAADRTVIAEGLLLATRLDGFTIQGATLTGNDGRSSYAVWVNGSHQALTIANSVVQGGRGADGVPGDPGVDLACGTVGVSGGVATDCNSSGGGFGTAAGDPTAAGNPGGGGANYCVDACPAIHGDGVSDGSDGKPGADGSNGTGGVPASDTIGAFASGLWQGPVGGAGTRGLNGTGGGGGGSGGTKRIRACFGCGTLLGGRGGDGAPGGCGGGGGAGGGAGGGGFGLVIIDSDVTLDNVSISGGSGGVGGAGGDGRAGAAGGTNVDNGRTNGAASTCGLIDYWAGNGGHGGVGGRGGAGGGGAGGIGGLSVGLVRVGASSVTTLGTVAVHAGSAGAGGPGGQGPGAPGSAGPAGSAFDTRTY